jgi:type VI secretion system protein ImpH
MQDTPNSAQPTSANAQVTGALTESRAGEPRRPSPEYAAWLERLTAEPYRYDFYQALRRIESAHPHLPRFGEALRPRDEPLRVAQSSELSFAASSVRAVEFQADGKPRLMQHIFGLLGPNGPLPLHFTELARDRAIHHADPTLHRFLDTFTHRFALLFYRAWAAAQPVLSLDRPGDSAFSRRLGALFGIGSETQTGRDAIGDAPKLHFAGRLARQARDADGLLAWCRSVFDAPVQIEQWCGHWMALSNDERSRLRARDAQGLGRGAVLGASVWDVQHKFRIVMGPLTLQRYHDFLPGGRDLARLQAMVRQWVGLEFEWDLKLVLARAEVPALRLGYRSVPGLIGRTFWLGRYTRQGDAKDLTIDVERTLVPVIDKLHSPAT